MVDERRRIALVAVIVAACGLVAVAARSDLADGTAAAFTIDRRANNAAGVALGAVTLLAVLLVVWASWGGGGTRAPVRRRTWRDTAALIVAIALLGILFSTMDPPARQSRDDRVDGSAEVGAADGDSAVDQQPSERASATGSVLIAVGALVVLGLAIAATRSRRSPASDGPTGADLDDIRSAATMSSTADAITRAVDAARSEPDPRASIVLAYRAAEIALRGGPLRRPASVAPREWLGSIRARAGAGSEIHLAMRTLTTRYEVARFSTHAPTALDREAALDALVVVVAPRPASSPA